MIAATNIALTVGRTNSVTAGRIADAVLSLGRLPEVNVSAKKILARLQNDKKVQVALKESVLRGGKRCVFEIRVTDAAA